MNKNRLLYLLVLLFILPCMAGCNSNYDALEHSYESSLNSTTIKLEKNDEEFVQKGCYTYEKKYGMTETSCIILYYDYDTNMNLSMLSLMVKSFVDSNIKVSIIDVGGKTQSDIRKMTYGIAFGFSYPSVPIYLAGINSSGIVAGNKQAKIMIEHQEHPFDGIILYGDTLSEKYDFSNTDLKVLCMYGSNDNILTSQDIEDSKIYYPTYSEFFKIEGANHTNMHFPKDSTVDNGDLEATISLSEQINILTNETIDFLYEAEIKEGTNND